MYARVFSSLRVGICRGTPDQSTLLDNMRDPHTSSTPRLAVLHSESKSVALPLEGGQSPGSSASSLSAAATSLSRCWYANVQSRPGLAALSVSDGDSPLASDDLSQEVGMELDCIELQRRPALEPKSPGLLGSNVPHHTYLRRPSPKHLNLTSSLAQGAPSSPSRARDEKIPSFSDNALASRAVSSECSIELSNSLPSWLAGCTMSPSTEASLASNGSSSSAALSSAFLPPSVDQERRRMSSSTNVIVDTQCQSYGRKKVVRSVSFGDHKTSGANAKNVSFQIPAIETRLNDSMGDIRSGSSCRLDPVHVPIDLIELRVLRSKFGELDVDGVGMIGKDEFHKLFADVVQLPETVSSADKENLLEFAYTLFTGTEAEAVRLRDFVAGCVVLGRGTDDERLRYLFQTFDSNKSGTLTNVELERVFQVMMSYAYARSIAVGSKPPLQCTDPAAAAVESSRLAEKALREHGKCSTGELTCEQFVAWCSDEHAVKLLLKILCLDTANGMSRLRKQREEKMIQMELANMGFGTNSNKSWSESYNLVAAAAGSSTAIDASISSSDSAEKLASLNSFQGVHTDVRMDSPQCLRRPPRTPVSRPTPGLRGRTTSDSLQGASDAEGTGCTESSLRMTRTPQRTLIDDDAVQVSRSVSGRLGQFEIDFSSLQLICKIGEGSFASVWRGKWLDTDVAVKILKSGPQLRPQPNNAGSSSLSFGQSKELECGSTGAGLEPQSNGGPQGMLTKFDDSCRTLDDTLEPELASKGDLASLQESHNFSESVLSTARDRSQFMREIGLLTSLRHPNVLLLMGACTDPRYPLCIVSELVDGASLYSYLHGKRRRERNLRVSLKIALDVARGMLYLHSSNPIVLHRDLKSANILVQNIDEEDAVKATIIDFGLSRLDIAKAESRMGGVGGGMCGSLVTMAPEVMRQSPYQPASDVYSFGVILAELFTGRVPFESLNALQLMYAVGLQGKRPDILPSDGIPSSLTNLINACWAQEPNERPSFASVVANLNCIQRELFVHGSEKPR